MSAPVGRILDESTAGAAAAGSEGAVAPGTEAPARAADWRGHQERGSAAGLRFMAWAATTMGRPVTRLLLWPITLYFLLTATSQRRASLDYLSRVLGRPAGWRDVFRHIHTFASVILDRVFLLRGDVKSLDVAIEGKEAFEAAYRQGRGMLMIGAHFGNFDALRCIAEYTRDHLPVSILMHEDNAQKMRDVLGAVAPHMRERVIGLGHADTFLKVEERLRAGEIVGLLADRSLAGERGVQIPFLGEPAKWSTGAMLLASMVDTPVVLFFPIYRGGNRYELRMELFAERIKVDRRRREAELAEWTARYAARIEAQVRDAPFNWFNFFDFWRR